MITVEDIANGAVSALLAAVVTFMVTTRWADHAARLDWERESIRAGFATYDTSSGLWRWKTSPELRESPAFKITVSPVEVPAPTAGARIFPPSISWDMRLAPPAEHYPDLFYAR